MSRHGWYTFGNHFHWVGMQWLWGTGILGRSVDDMLDFIEQTGAPGNINFDSMGYERLAADEPVAIEKLRTAVADGRIEIAGGTFGQPYALFHHGESAVRQLTYGVRTAQRVVGARPRSFWEEEFCFFPQLPQLLTATGYSYASLFFQWTWHTPELPVETVPAIHWTGIDGSAVLALPRSALNLHQWPEDVEELIRSGEILKAETPVVQQWLELLPSPDWMCRSELVIPGVRSLFDTSGVEFRAGTLSTVLEGVKEHAEVREYTMDDVFHGMSIGKNGNRHHRMSQLAENTLLAAEAFSVISGDLGRPYAHWGKYPGWELEEGWRELLSFQAHDNDECEGLNGHIGYFGVERGIGLGRHVLERTLTHLANTLVEVGEQVVANPLGWQRDAVVDGELVSLAPFSVTPSGALSGRPVEPVTVVSKGELFRLRRGSFSVDVDARTGCVTRIGAEELVDGLGGLTWIRGGVVEEFVLETITIDHDRLLLVRRAGDAVVTVTLSLADEIDALDIAMSGDLASGPDGRYHASLVTRLELPDHPVELRHDTPYAVSSINARNSWSRKYPTGAWMTSPQEFEEVKDVFTALQFVDFVRADGSGVLWIHDGAQGFHRSGDGVANVLSMRDPWDEDYFVSELEYRARFVPHGQVTDRWRWTAAQESTRRPQLAVAESTIKSRIEGYAEQSLGLYRVEEAAGTVVTAVYRDSDFAASGFSDHVNHLARQPVLMRLVELEGQPDVVRFEFAQAPVAAWTCSPLGERLTDLAIEGRTVGLSLRAHEIATIAVAFPPAPGDNRTLDDDRGIWATIHHDAPTNDR